MIICTMTTASHLYRARVLAESAKAYHKEAKFVLCLTEKTIHPEANKFPFFDQVILSRQLQVGDFPKYIFMRKVNEASYALKGHFLKYLLQAFPSENEFVFLDTDIEVLSPMDEIHEALERHPILLTPHEIHDAKKSYMLHGIINIGFIAFRRSEETFRFLDWWIDRVDRYGFDENYSQGLFYEQNWLNLALAYFNIHILEHPGYNVAYWNLHERGNSITLQDQRFLVDGQPIRFFHFSHVHESLLRFMNKFITNGNKAMYILRDRYLSKLLQAGSRKLSRTPWSYDYYASGRYVSPEARTFYRKHEDLALKYPNPFLASNGALIGNRSMTIVMLMSNSPYAYPLPPFNQGGTEKIVYDLSEELVRRGHNVYVYAPAGSKSSAHVIHYPLHLKERDIAGFVASTIPKHADIIHDHTFGSVTRHRKWNVPAVCTHHIPINNRVKHPVYVSKRALNMFGKNIGYANYNGILPEDYQFSEEKNRYLLFIGRILPSKGVHHAINVAELTGRKLIIAGPVKDEAYFNEKLKPKIAGNSNIEYVGAVGGQRKLDLLKHAGCLLFPSVYEEPFGLTMIEAMVSGTPVLALRNGAVPEVMAGFPNLICDSVQEMADKVMNEPFPPPLELREYVLNNFTVKQMTDGYLQIYEEVRNKPRAIAVQRKKILVYRRKIKTPLRGKKAARKPFKTMRKSVKAIRKSVKPLRKKAPSALKHRKPA